MVAATSIQNDESVFSYQWEELPPGILSTLANLGPEELTFTLHWILINTRAYGEEEEGHPWYWQPEYSFEDISDLSPALYDILATFKEHLPEVLEPVDQIILYLDSESNSYTLHLQGDENDMTYTITEEEAMEYLDFVKYRGVYSIHGEMLPF